MRNYNCVLRNSMKVNLHCQDLSRRDYYYYYYCYYCCFLLLFNQSIFPDITPG